MGFHAKKNVVRKYYKYSDIPNVTVVGSPTITNGVVSNFSSSNYLTSDIDFVQAMSQVNNWEFVLRFKANLNGNYNTILINGYVNSSQSIAYGITIYAPSNSGIINMSICHTGSTTASSSINFTSGTLTNNTVYDLKITFDGSSYKASLSSDLKDADDETKSWTQFGSKNETRKIKYSPEYPTKLGCLYNGSYPMSGSIDFNHCYLKTDNKLLWLGIKIIEATEDDYDFYKDIDVYKVPEKQITKYYKYSSTETLINPDGLIDTKYGGGGWIIYDKGSYGEVARMLNPLLNTSYPRWQTDFPAGTVAYLKTPQKGIISSYLTTQWVDENGRWSGRCCNHWIIKGYENKDDLLNQVNGTIIDENTWDRWHNNGYTKTINLSSNIKGFQYYSLQMISNIEGSSSYISMGNTKFYMKLPIEATEDDYDFYEDIDVYKTFKKTIIYEDVPVYKAFNL